MTDFAAYTEQPDRVIWGIGATEIEALTDGKEWIREHNQLGWSPVKFRMKDLIVVPCTPFVVKRVGEHGGDCHFRIVGGVMR